MTALAVNVPVSEEQAIMVATGIPVTVLVFVAVPEYVIGALTVNIEPLMVVVCPTLPIVTLAPGLVDTLEAAAGA